MPITTAPNSSRLNRRDALALFTAPLIVLAAQRASAQAAAGLQSYDVELVVFRNLSSSASNEQWAAESNTAITEDTAGAESQAEAAPVTAPTATFPPLPPARLKLTAVEDTLRRSRRYQPLAHFGWTQPGYARNDARFTPLESVMGSNASGLTGRIALARGRYLHLTLDLALVDQDGQRYQLQQTRRMRSTERHYIDHPKFGVIALITPAEA
jgi:hypothetical protein